MTVGVVAFFLAEDGWGAISAGVLPPGRDVWVHYSVIEADGYRSLESGEAVEFEYEEVSQDGFDFRATRVARVADGGLTATPADRLPDDADPLAYRSTLTIEWDHPSGDTPRP